MKIWIDGKIVDPDAARVPVLDHGYLYGDGVFEGIRVRRGHVFRFDDHLTRLERSARAIGMALPVERAGIREIVLETLRAFGQDEAYVRLIVSRGEGALSIDPDTCPHPRLVCIAAAIRLYPSEKLEAGIDLATASMRRPTPDVLDPTVKSLNYLNNILAKQEAHRHGADEALMLNAAGRVAEASGANVFGVVEDVLVTPPLSECVLGGITRAGILELAAELGIAAREAPLSRPDLLGASEVFLSGSGAGLVPVHSLDGQVLGAGRPGPVFERIAAAFPDYAVRNGTPV